VRETKKGTVHCLEIPPPCNKYEPCSHHQNNFAASSRKKELQSVLPPMLAADMAFIKTLLDNSEKSSAKIKEKRSETF
jgi:hypothetical protein